MVSIADRLGGWDWDGIFSYNTKKMVQIRDRRLGVLRLLMLATIGTFIICDLLINERYNVYERPVPGAVRSSLELTDAFKNTDPFCNQNRSCVYWSTNQIATSVTFDTYTISPNCLSSTRPLLAGNQSVAALRSQSSPQLTVNLKGNSDCAYDRNMSQPISYYIGLIDNYTILLEHTIRNRMTNQIFNSYQLDGSLVSKDESSGDLKLLEYFGAKDNILGNNTDNTVTSRSNKVSINSLLKAAKASLDENTRKNGLVLTVYIDYQNQSNIFAKNKKVLYSYQVEVASGMKADRVEVVPTSAQTVTEIRRKGIRIIFQQTGSFGQFSFVTLLIYLCIILLLSAIATLLLEMLMIYVLPQRYLYYARKYDLYNGVKEARPTGMVALDDDASFYTAHQSAMLASAIALNGCVSPAQARHMSLLRVMNPTDRSIESSLSSRSYSEPRRRTTSLPSTMRQVHNEAVPSEPPSYFSRNSQSYGHLTPMDRVSENSENQQTSSTLSKAPTHPHYTITNNLAESNKNSQSSDNEEDLSMVSIALDDATPPPRVNYAQQQNMPRASLEQTRLPPIYLVDTSQTTSTLPCETRQDLSCSYGSSTDQSLANQASVAPSSMLSRSHQPQGHAPALLPASARIYRYEPESSRNSWTSNAPITPHAYRSKPRAIDTSSITSNVITSFIREPEEALVEDPSNVLSDNTIMSYFSANATQISIPDVVVEDTEGEEMPEILLSFNPLLNQSVETGYMAADDNEHEDISNEFTSEYESRDESSGADTSTPAPTTNRSFSDSDTCLANAIYAMEMLGSDSSFIVEQI